MFECLHKNKLFSFQLRSQTANNLLENSSSNDLTDDLNLIISRLEKELNNVKAELATTAATIEQLQTNLETANAGKNEKSTIIARLEAERDAAKDAQRQAESQTLIFKDLFEELILQHNQTCIAKTEELQNQVKFDEKNV